MIQISKTKSHCRHHQLYGAELSSMLLSSSFRNLLSSEHSSK